MKFYEKVLELIEENIKKLPFHQLSTENSIKDLASVLESEMSFFEKNMIARRLMEMRDNIPNSTYNIQTKQILSNLIQKLDQKIVI